MNTSKAVAVASLVTSLSSALCSDMQEKIILQSSVLKLVDGNFFNADRIEDIRSLQFQINSLLRGDLRTDGTRVGRYTLQEKIYNVRELLALEEKLDALEKKGESNTKTCEQLCAVLEKAKNDFIIISNSHRDQAKVGKSFTAVLMEESCRRRNRMDCLLLIWAHAKTEKEEDEIFDKHVHTFDSFVIFLGDLFNFLTDLINSCPKAQELFRQRVEKFKAVKILLPKALNKTNISLDEMAFFKNLKEKHLNALVLENITLETVCTLITTFIHKKKTIIKDESN